MITGTTSPMMWLASRSCSRFTELPQAVFSAPRISADQHETADMASARQRLWAARPPPDTTTAPSRRRRWLLATSERDPEHQGHDGVERHHDQQQTDQVEPDAGADHVLDRQI